jgi:hypothetical protein
MTRELAARRLSAIALVLIVATALNSFGPSLALAGGAFVFRFGKGTAGITFGGTLNPLAWLTSRDLVSCNFTANLDAPPGPSGAWEFQLEYVTVNPSQSCDDIPHGGWTAVGLGRLSGADRSLTVNNIPVNIVAPACVRGQLYNDGTPADRGSGVGSIHCSDASGDGPTHFQGTATAVSTSLWYGGNLTRSTNDDRTHWINTGGSLQACSGVVTVGLAPGVGHSWHAQLAVSTTTLQSDPTKNCADLDYTTTPDLCTIADTNKSCRWPSTAVSIPQGVCLQLQVSCPGGACQPSASKAAAQYYSVECSTGTISTDAAGAQYETAGSGGFDSDHTFLPTFWAVADANKYIGGEPGTPGNVGVGSQRMWVAHPSGLNQCGGAFTFQNAITGGGSFDVGFRISTTAPTAGQSCVSLDYTNTATLCNIAVGAKNCVAPPTAVTIPGGACFSLNATARGTPAAGTANAFNWNVACRANSSAPPPASTPIAALQVAGPYWAGACGDSNVPTIGTTAWGHPSFATGSVGDADKAEADFASSGQISHWLVCTNFRDTNGNPISLPSNATLSGALFEWWGAGSSMQPVDAGARMVVGGIPQAADRSRAGVHWGTGGNDYPMDFGGIHDPWDSPTVAQVNDPSFGGAIAAQATGGGTWADINRVSLLLYYLNGPQGSPECVGDCNGDSVVGVDEIITLVNIALDTAISSGCPIGVPRGAEVDIGLIIQAVNNVLNGCSG